MIQTVTAPTPPSIAQKRREQDRARRILNVRLLVVSLAIGGILCLAGYGWYRYRRGQVATAFELRAATLQKEGQWREAAGYLNLYLQLRPDDSDARVRLVEAMEHSVETARQRRGLVGLLHQTLGMLPDRNDLRLKLADQLLKLDDAAEAESEAQKVLASPNTEDQRSARRLIAISLYKRARIGGVISIESAAKAMTAAQAENPGDVDLASLTATLYREHPQNVEVDNARSKALEIMDRLVQAAPDSDDALIARYRYVRSDESAAKARPDLELVLARHPDNAEALLLLANEDVAAGGESNLAAGEQKLEKFMKLRPADPRGALSLARLYTAKGEPQRVVDVLLKAHRQAETNGLEVNGLLAETLINLNRLDEAADVLKVFEDNIRQRLPEVSTDSRIRLENANRMLHARLDVGRNNLNQAARELNAILASVGETDVAAGVSERFHAQALLAVVMGKLGRIDLAAANWKAAADQAPTLIDARLKAAEAYLDLDRPGEAIGQLDAYLQSPSAAAEGWILLVRAHQQKQMLISVDDQRNWTEFSQVLEQAKQKFPERWEPQVAEVLYWQARGTDEYKQLAMQRLHELEKWRAADSKLLGRIALCYQQLGSTVDANRVFEIYAKSEPSRARQVMVHSALLVKQGQTDKAAEELAAVADALSGPERRELLLVRAKLLMAAGQVDAAQQAAASLIADSPHESAPLLLGIDIALMHQDFINAALWENRLKEISAGNDFDWRFCRARRLVAQFATLDAATRSELDSMLDGLRSERPDWYPVVSLNAQYRDLTGNRRQAIDAYRLSIDLGDRRPETIQRLVVALYAEGRFSDANAYLTRLNGDQPTDARLESLAIQLAVKENRLNEALEIAKRAVGRGANDPIHRIWLANLLSLNNEQKKAEGEFRDLIQKFPTDSRVWNALFTYLVRTKQPERARRALEQWNEKVPNAEPAKQFVLAQGYEMLGDMAKAQEYYRATIAGDSKNVVGARLRLGKLLLASDVMAARAEFEKALKIEPKNPDARRYMASLLAVSGSNDDWTNAMRMLQTSQPTGAANESAADDRLRAMLLSRRGRNRDERLANSETARQILTARLGKDDTAEVDLDRMLLAGILEQEAVIRGDSELVLAARDALRPLVDRTNPSTEYLVAYIQLLLRHVDKNRTASDSSAAEEERRRVLISDASLRIDQLEAALGANPTIENRIVPVAFRVRLLVAQDQTDQGQKRLRKFAQEQLASVAKDDERAKLLLQLGNLASAAGYHQEAEEWYQQLLAIAPKSYVLLAKSLIDQKKYMDAVDLCLRVAPNRPAGEIATVLTQLLSVAGNNKELEERAQPVIDAALNVNRDNIGLLMSAAVRQVGAKNDDEAIKLFRRVLQLQPNQALALNNLATLLAERPNELVEARECVDRAIAIGGRTPPLLDTLGTIEIHSGKPEQAIADLEEALAGTASDPRYYFHLAVAYQLAHREQDARQALGKAREIGLDQAILTAGDRELLSALNDKLPPTSGEKR